MWHLATRTAAYHCIFDCIAGAEGGEPRSKILHILRLVIAQPSHFNRLRRPRICAVEQFHAVTGVYWLYADGNGYIGASLNISFRGWRISRTIPQRHTIMLRTHRLPPLLL